MMGNTLASGPLARRTKTVQILATLLLCTAMAVVAVDAWFLQMSADPRTFEYRRVDWMNVVMPPLYLALVLFLVGTLAAFLSWQVRARANLMEIRGETLLAAPWWSLAWWFVPVANLIVPALLVRELWLASAAVENWRGQGSAWRATLWWPLFVLACGMMLWPVFWVTTDPVPGLADLRDFKALDLATTCAITLWAMLTMWLTGAIKRRARRVELILWPNVFS